MDSPSRTWLTPRLRLDSRRNGAVSEWSIEAVLKTVERDERSVGSNPTCSATFRCRIRTRAPIGAFFFFVLKGVGRAIRPLETGRLTRNGSPNGPCLSSSAPRRPRDGAKHPRISNRLLRSWGRPVREIIRWRRPTRKRRAVRRTAPWWPITRSARQCGRSASPPKTLPEVPDDKQTSCP